MNKRWPALLGLTLLVLTGCTGIPASSAPQVVRTVPRPLASATHIHITPHPGEGPEEVVRDFVRTGVDVDAAHSTSKQFLTPGEAGRWQDNPTVILDSVTYGLPKISGDTATMQVSGHRMGQLDANGIFSPTLKGLGIGDLETFDFQLLRTPPTNQWRIDQLPAGVLIDQTTFTNSYQQRVLYFRDAEQSILVPDLRYTPLTGPPLASWLLAELVVGPRPELAQSVNPVPDLVAKPTVKLGNPTVVEMPGTAQLDNAGRNDLAAQLAFTLAQVQFSGQLELTDTGKPLRIAIPGGVQFNHLDFASYGQSEVTSPRDADPARRRPSIDGLYYVRAGVVVDNGGSPLSSQFGQPGHNFRSVALRSLAQSLQAAGLTAANQVQTGTGHGLIPITLPQLATSRPDWRPNSDEVWIGAGNRLYRLTAGAAAQPVSLTSQVGTVPTGSITAVRFSSDGDRVALVIDGPSGLGGAWIGSVVGTNVRVDSLEPLTPPALAVTDLAWAGPTKLELLAAEPGAEPRVRTIYSDGSRLDAQDSQPNVGLPGPPVAITAAPDKAIVVSTGNGSIWKYNPDDGNWTSLSGAAAPTLGTNPVYSH
jgi:hypothetical protein